MTTTVTIVHEGPSTHDVEVWTQNTDKDGISRVDTATGPAVLKIGHRIQFYIYPGHELVIKERPSEE